MARHARGANRTLRLATRRRVLAIQPLELGGLLVVEHAPEIVVVFHALVPADRLSCREGSPGEAGRSHPQRGFESRMRTAGPITPA